MPFERTKVRICEGVYAGYANDIVRFDSPHHNVTVYAIRTYDPGRMARMGVGKEINDTSEGWQAAIHIRVRRTELTFGVMIRPKERRW